MHKSEILCVCFIFLYTLAVFPSSTKKNASLFYLCSCLCRRGLFTGKSLALVSFTGEVDRNSGQDVTVYSQCCISKPLFLFQVLSKTFVLYSSLIITCNSCSSPGKAGTPLYWRLKSLLQQTHCCVSFFLSLSANTSSSVPSAPEALPGQKAGCRSCPDVGHPEPTGSACRQRWSEPTGRASCRTKSCPTGMTLTNLRKGEEGTSRERGGAGRESKRKQEKWEKKLDEIGRSE